MPTYRALKDFSAVSPVGGDLVVQQYVKVDDSLVFVSTKPTTADQYRDNQFVTTINFLSNHIEWYVNNGFLSLSSADVNSSAPHRVSSSSTPIFNFNQNSKKQKYVMTSDISPTFAGAAIGDEISILFVQDVVGGRAVTWPDNVVSIFQPATDANSRTLFKFYLDDDGTYMVANTPVGQ